jgi:peptidoglycan/LPS O-acetylase OafA/YrhL
MACQCDLYRRFFGTPYATAHFWTLGVEEQFYLLWPELLDLSLHRYKNDDGTNQLKFLAVHASYCLLEKPLLGLRARFREV